MHVPEQQLPVYFNPFQSGTTDRAVARPASGATPARPTSQQAMGAAVRSELWAATPASSSIVSISSAEGGSVPISPQNASIHSSRVMAP
jgi:hypothetical protein